MRDRFLAAWRTAAQALFALVVAWLAGRGIHVSGQFGGLVEVVVMAAGAGLWAAAVHWLQSQTGSQWWARPARFVGRVLVLGAAALPSYPAAAPRP